MAEQIGPGIPACPQTGDRYAPFSEDCLFLNVWRRQDARPRRPVMVYFHGGAYSTGSVTDPLNDGATLAERGDVVVVTVNHRLNALGYLYSLPARSLSRQRQRGAARPDLRAAMGPTQHRELRRGPG
jgi:para-nitrobenzyl esterase